jgi:hypothetical protein
MIEKVHLQGISHNVEKSYPFTFISFLEWKSRIKFTRT